MGSPDDRDQWPEPPEPSAPVRALVLLVASAIVVGAALFGAASNDPGTGSFYLFLGAAALGLGLAIREAANLVARRHEPDGSQGKDG